MGGDFTKDRPVFPREVGYEFPMKNLIFAISLITSSLAIACPDLSGTYAVCRSKNNVLIEGTDLTIKYIPIPHVNLFQISFLPDGTSEREEILLSGNGVPAKKSWVGSTGIKYESVSSARCLGNLLQVRTDTTFDGRPYVNETSQYFKQGDDLVRISRGTTGELRYVDILTCR